MIPAALFDESNESFREPRPDGAALPCAPSAKPACFQSNADGTPAGDHLSKFFAVLSSAGLTTFLSFASGEIRLVVGALALDVADFA